MYNEGDEFQNENKPLTTNYKYKIDHFIDKGAFGFVYKVRRVYEPHTNLDVEINLNKLDFFV
jgi:hypothetical protein